MGWGQTGAREGRSYIFIPTKYIFKHTYTFCIRAVLLKFFYSAKS